MKLVTTPTITITFQLEFFIICASVNEIDILRDD